MVTLVEKFQDALAEHGLTFQLIADGRKHRVSTPDAPRKQNGEYVVIPGAYAAYRDYKTGLNLCVKQRDVNAGDAATIRAARQQARLTEDAQQAQAKAQAAQTVAWIWDHATPITAHPYLTRKGVTGHGLREWKGALVIPYYKAGQLATLQFINADGAKRYAKGADKRGAYHLIALPPRSLREAVACEGYATGATLCAAFDLPVVVCGDTSGVIPGLTQFRADHRETLRLTYYADNDQWTPGNPGLKTARAVVAAFPDVVAKRPDFLRTASHPTDFNDLAALEGLAAVRCYCPASPYGRDLGRVDDRRLLIAGNSALLLKQACQG